MGQRHASLTQHPPHKICTVHHAYKHHGYKVAVGNNGALTYKSRMGTYAGQPMFATHALQELQQCSIVHRAGILVQTLFHVGIAFVVTASTTIHSWSYVMQHHRQLVGRALEKATP